MTLRGGLATGDGWGHVDLRGVFQRENSATRFEVDAGISGIDILRYHGLGNDTEGGVSQRLFFVELSQARLEPRVVLLLGIGKTKTLQGEGGGW